jgi:hypothetical protein
LNGLIVESSYFEIKVPRERIKMMQSILRDNLKKSVEKMVNLILFGWRIPKYILLLYLPKKFYQKKRILLLIRFPMLLGYPFLHKEKED